MEDKQIQQKKLIWFDCDPGIDDAIALLMIRFIPNSQLLGISTVVGNTIVENCTHNALGLLKLYGFENVPVYQGQSFPLIREPFQQDNFHGKNGLSGFDLPETQQKAIYENIYEKIYQIFKSQKQKIIIVATAALTNIALLLKLYPDIKNYIEYVSVMGGGIAISNVTPVAEFNVWVDPDASQLVYHSDLKIYLAPLDITHTVLLTREYMNQFTKENSNFFKSIKAGCEAYMQAYNKFGGRIDAPMHDPVSVFFLLRPELFEIQYLNVEVETQSQICFGQTVVDIRQQTKRQPNIYILMKLNDKKEFWDTLANMIYQCDKISPANQKK